MAEADTSRFDAVASCRYRPLRQFPGERSQMTAEIVNLRRAKKAKARMAKDALATQNRALHGRSKAERENEALAKERVRRELDGARRIAPGSGAAPDKDGSDDGR